MSQPRHQPKGGVPVQGAGDVKLKLRIPTDGSVDLDELRRALERHRDRKPQSPAPEPEVIPEPEVLPAPEPAVIREPSWLVTWFAQNKLLAAAIGSAVIAFISGVTWLTQSSGAAGASALLVWIFWLNIIFLCGAFGQILRTHLAAQPKIDEPSESWLWVRKNAVTVVALFSAVTAFVVGLLWVGQYTAANKSQPALVWAFWILVGVFCVAFSFVVKKQLAVEDSISSTVWAKIKERPVVVLSSVVGVAAIVALVFFGLSKLQTSPSTEVAKGDPAPNKSVKPNPQPPLPIEPPPVKPPKKVEPGTPPTQPEPPVVEEPGGPAPGWGGRLMSTGIASSLLFGGLFMVTRQRKKKFPSEDALQYGASLGHIQFWRGLRYFIAGHGGFYLFAFMVGLLYTVYQSPLSLWLVVFLSLLTIPVAGGAVLACGYAGVNLMPTLDMKVEPSANSSSTVRFLKQKAMLATMIGLALAAFFALLNKFPMEIWGQLAARNSVTYGFLGAFIWKLGGLAVHHESVSWPESKTPERARTALYFNLPLWGGLTVVANLLIITITDLGWRDFWWLSFITGILVAGLTAVLRTNQHFLLNIHHTLVWAGLGTMVVSYFWDGPVWFWVLFASGIFIMAVVMKGITSLSESGRYFIVPPSKKPYKKSIEPTRDGVNIQWGNLTAAAAFLLLFTGTALGWVWSGNDPSVEENDESFTVTSERAERSIRFTPENNQNQIFVPSMPPKGDKEALRKAVQDYYDGLKVRNPRSGVAGAWKYYARAGYPLADYNLAFTYIDNRQMPAFNTALHHFSIAAKNGHAHSAYNAGVLIFRRLGSISVPTESLENLSGNRAELERKIGKALLSARLQAAERFFAMAYRQGHPAAARELAVVYREMKASDVLVQFSDIQMEIEGQPSMSGPMKLIRIDLIDIQ